MTDINKDKKETNYEEMSAVTPGVDRTGRFCVWASVILAVLSWILLMVTNGYVALGVGIAAIVAGFAGALRNEHNLRRVAITATIAAAVLVVILASFIIVIKIGLEA